MGRIKKILENELIGGTQSTDVYPVTSIKAVYDDNSERLDHILNRRGVVNVSTNYNDDHIAEVLTLAQAIAKVPSADRVIGFQGKYLASDGWHTIIYTGNNLTNWDDETKWIDSADKILNIISNNATFAGIATPATNPGTPDGPIFYFASAVGTYSNFGGVVLNNPGLIVLHNLTGTWDSMKVYECLQEFGNSTSSPMSQKATTEAIQAETERAKTAEQANATSIIGTNRIADGAVTTEKLAAGAVTTAKIANNSITPTELMDGAVTFMKLNPLILYRAGITVFNYSFLNMSKPIDFASSLSTTPNIGLRGIVTKNDIPIGYMDSYGDEFGFIITQTFKTRAVIDADNNINSYTGDKVYTYIRQANVADTSWPNWKLLKEEDDGNAAVVDSTVLATDFTPSSSYIEKVLTAKTPIAELVKNGDNANSIGILFTFSDFMKKSITQVLISNTSLSSTGEFENYWSAVPGIYSRNYGVESGPTPVGTWSKWGLSIPKNTLTESMLALELQAKLNASYNLGTYLGILDNESSIDTITKTGFYSYRIGTTRYNLIVQTYPERWVVQYQFTANNINRRYTEWNSNTNSWESLWTPWRSISTAWSKFDPNADYIANSKLISEGLKDANKKGLFVGNVLNNRYTAFSDISLAKMYNKFLQEELNSLFNSDSTYNGKTTQESGWADDGTYIKSDDNIVFFSKNNGGHNTGYGYYIVNGKIQLLQDVIGTKLGWNKDRNNECLIRIAGTFYYAAGTLNVNGTGTCLVDGAESTDYHGEKSSESGHSVFYIHVTNANGNSVINLHADTYFYVESITISRNSKEIVPGDAASLIYALSKAKDGETIYVPEGIYNVGFLDDTAYSGLLNIAVNNLTIRGAGKDKTFICGVYANKYSIVHSLLHNKGAYNTFKDFSVVAEYIKSIEGQAPTVTDNGIDSVWINCGIYGGQDTIVIGSAAASHLYYKCDIDGTVDFICGGATSGSTPNTDFETLFKECNILLKGRAVGNCICAPQGVIAFTDCVIDNNKNYEYDQNEIYHLARPWGNNSIVLFKNTQYNVTTLGYTKMSAGVNFASGYGDTGGVDPKKTPISNYVTPSTSFIYDYIDNFLSHFEDTNRINTLLSE